jgi:hypothetical protein
MGREVEDYLKIDALGPSRANRLSIARQRFNSHLVSCAKDDDIVRPEAPGHMEFSCPC